MKLTRILILSLILAVVVPSMRAQETPGEKYPADKRFYEVVDRWVMFPETGGDSTYFYGFIYIDEMAGFTFDCVNTFTIDVNGAFVPDPLEAPLNLKVRLTRDWNTVAVIPEDKMNELGLPPQPEWLHLYKRNEHTDGYSVRVGSFYNGVRASGIALGYLEKVYIKAPETKGLAFELAFAYNALEQYDKGSVVAMNALITDPDNPLLYKELVHALCNLDRMDEAEKAVARGIEKTENRYYKAEMSINMVQAYYRSGDKEKFLEWYGKAKTYAARGSAVDQFAEYMKAEMEKGEMPENDE